MAQAAACEDLPTSQMSDAKGIDGRRVDSRLLVPRAAGARGGTHEALPTSQMSDPNG